MEALENEPSLYPDLTRVWNAFNDLSRTRPIGFAPGAISIREITAWLDLHLIDDPEIRLWYVRMIGEMDKEWRTWALEELKKKSKSDGNRRTRS